MKLNNDFINSLINSANPTSLVGTRLLKLWREAAEREKKIGNFYYKGEEEAKAFEEFILKCYSEFYKNLAQQCVNTTPTIDKNKDTTCVLLDGMSLREGVLIHKMFKSKGFGSSIDFGFSAIPSDTLPFREKMDISQSKFREIKNSKNINISGDEEYIWCYFPDVMLDKIKAGHTVISSLEEMYKTTVGLVKELVEKIKNKKIIILSDHGYIRSESGFVFSVPSKESKELQKLFGSKRNIKIDDIEAGDLINKGYVEEFFGYYLVKSRYVWPVKGKYSIYIHGGLSLMECFTPVIKINKK